MISLEQFGVVSLALDKRTGKHYAIKSINKRSSGAPFNTFCKDVRNEVEIMFHLGGHDNIVQLHEVYEDNDAIHLIMVRAPSCCQAGVAHFMNPVMNN